MSNVVQPAEHRPEIGRRVLRTLRRMLSELGFLLPSLPIAILGCSLIVSLFAVGVGTVLTFVGVFLLIGALVAARWFGMVEVARLRLAGRRDVPQPTPAVNGAEAGVVSRLKRVLTDRQYWSSLLHGAILNPMVSIFSWTVTVAWLAVGLGGASHWIWSQYAPDPERDSELSTVLANWLQPHAAGWVNAAAADDLLWAAAGAAFLLTLPLVTRGLVALHAFAARGTLAGSRLRPSATH
ncbi:sensor domain-containing protein [Lysobacter korlensis]|uniref:Sensor domain-containing protein n=1 Tax=Lysobacter korlensis TaxID=553636 RepID=A0ABV6S0N6_9GAMM